MFFLILGQKFGDEMTLHSIHLRIEGKRWRIYWQEKYRKGSTDWKPIKKLKSVDGKDRYVVEETTDSLIETLNATDKCRYICWATFIHHSPKKWKNVNSCGYEFILYVD